MTYRIMRYPIVLIVIMVTVLIISSCTNIETANQSGEIEALEYQGVKLTPLHEQGNNALKGTLKIARNDYILTIDGMIGRTLRYSYDDLAALSQESRLAVMPCVEGWQFTSKWTGPVLADMIEPGEPAPNANWVIFHTIDADGYTSLPMDYLRDKRIIAALRINDLTLPPERGFPFQVVAVDKYGYKWAKWVVRMELTDHEFRGYWESRGYSNDATVGGPAFDKLPVP